MVSACGVWVAIERIIRHSVDVGEVEGYQLVMLKDTLDCGGLYALALTQV